MRVYPYIFTPCNYCYLALHFSFSLTSVCCVMACIVEPARGSHSLDANGCTTNIQKTIWEDRGRP